MNMQSKTAEQQQLSRYNAEQRLALARAADVLRSLVKADSSRSRDPPETHDVSARSQSENSIMSETKVS